MSFFKCLIVLSGLFFVSPCFAQSDSSISSRYSKLGYFFNPGISAGLGGARPLGYIPQASLKLGRVELGFTPLIKLNNKFTISGQVDVDLWKFSGFKKKSANASIGIGGYLQIDETNQVTHSVEGLTLLVGVNQNISKHSKVALKIGLLGKYAISYLGEYPDRDIGANSILSESKKWYPYGEVAFKLYLFSLSDKPKVDVTNSRKKIKLDPVKIRDGFAKWFNPIWSVGVGTDRAFFAIPSGGIRINKVELTASAMLFFDISAGGSLNIDAWKFKETEKRKYFLTLGASGYGRGSEGSGWGVYGISTGLSTYKKFGRHSFKLNFGAGRWTYSSFYEDIEDNTNNRSITTRGYMPLGSFSYNLYLFKF
jgi:hypothetical protein